ncbi:integrase [Burkholderia vietnamiensis]|uniref:Tyrosine-type recombinase/integrase n=1 Tax=Burkholderia vietnamiensis TaxID=60552 RepID=A0AAW7T160_BURVI|nr:integrase arm-type DNA-binding domain-containing protein [Burkholderia vietnamiensis]KKI36754.1 integrase [Burkholderia vietnamiensis]KVG07034.1 integrase [Burkholderia vietnamiensis]MDN7795661.1 tyrosine-type recombinase/integrase [Burkholderia vietnamiensis]MDN8038749.1 tyrosine-type recombinase/integrase [Burkholderia vietnamiensis]HDR9187986.1 tyrosine-type recombinase/integrase [Burkholderia vietnamiensis]
MPLTDVAVRAAKPREKSYKLADGQGMYLEIMPNGSKYWRLKHRIDGKEKRMALGVYPAVTLLAARKARDEIKDQLRAGLDPSHEKKRVKAQRSLDRENSFEPIAREWHQQKKGAWRERHADRIMKLLERELFPAIGARPIAEIMAPELLAVIRKIEARDAIELAHKTIQATSQIFRYAIATGRAERDSAPDLRGALKPRFVVHMRRVSEAELPELMRQISAYDGDFQTRLALQFMALTFVRTSELRFAEWTEIDEKKEWRIPPEKMKMRTPHIVPLSTQALEVIAKLPELNGHSQFLFPSRSSSKKPMSENTILYALYRMGYHSRMTGHGFRGLASTILNEHSFNRDWIERQLAHSERDGVRAAYNHAEYLPERRKMMQWWSNYLWNAVPK